MNYFFSEATVPWKDHPKVKGGKSAELFTKEEHGAHATIGLAMLPAGEINDWHDHGEAEDIIFILGGKAKLELEGIGVFNLEKGSHAWVPGFMKHRIFDIIEDLTLYHIKAPATK